MNILYTFNDKFVPQVAAAITSVCENNKEIENICFYLMILNVTNENKEKLETYIHSYNRKVCFIELKDINQYFDFSLHL